MKLRDCALILGLGLAAGATALAQTTISTDAAILTESKGQVRMQVGDAAPQPLLKGRPLLAHGILETGPESNAVIVFPDGMVLALGPNSRFSVNKYDYDPATASKNAVSLNLIEGAARVVMGAIGEQDPALVRLQVGTSTLAGAGSGDANASPTDAAVSVQGTVSLMSVSIGQASFTLASGETFQVASGDAVFVQANGSVLRGSAAEIQAQAGKTAAGRQLVSSLGEMTALVLPEGRTVVTLSTAPGLLDLPPLTTTTFGTAATGASGGGTPCTASCN